MINLKLELKIAVMEPFSISLRWSRGPGIESPPILVTSGRVYKLTACPTH